MNNEPSSSSYVTTAPAIDLELTQLFPGDSELATRMRALDWSQTPLRAVETWPQSLRTSLSICLTSRFPILIWWGRELVMLYNDAYRPILGVSKHPQAIGQRGQECWAEIWHEIGPMLESVLNQGEATWSDDKLLLLDRNGYLEECYFTFSYSPILDETGGIGGIFTAVTETTERVLSERRLLTLSELAAKTAEITTVAAVYAASATVLAANPDDIPFALLYALDATDLQASLTAATGLVAGTELSPSEVSCGNSTTDLSRCFDRVLQTGDPQLFDLADCIDRSAHSMAIVPKQAMVMPVARSGQAQLAGFLVVGVSPRRALDRNYSNFFELVAGQIATALANARTYEAERQRAEALAELDRAKTVFFSNVSHEFRTPLTLMISPLAELSNSLTDRLQPDEREQLQLIERNGLRLQKLVNTLLDFSRIEAGRVQASYEPTDLATYTAELASTFRSLVERAGVELEIDCPPLSETVYVDRQMWEKIVFNLISNAFKFTFAGTITVRLRSVGAAVALSVRDTGVGIPTTELPRLFERFYRVSGTRSRTYEGSGIGLALVQELVKLHQGTIDVTSVEGVGTCFTLSIPTGTAHLPPDRIDPTRTLASTAVGADAYLAEALRWLPESQQDMNVLGDEEQSSSSPRRENFSSARIILADDNADMRDYLRRLLSQQYEVVAVSDGIAAVSAVRQQLPDLILTDVMMPNLDGLGLLQALRCDPQTQEIPMILLSARAGEEARIEGLTAGADDYLTKPFSARELLARVDATLKLARLRQEATQQEQTLRLTAETAQQQVETILSSIRDGFYVLDRDWCFTYVNDRLCEMTAMSRSEIIGRSIWDLFPDLGTDLYSQFQRAMCDQTPIQFENLYVTRDVWYEHRIYPSPDGLTVFAADITDRKIAQISLQQGTRAYEYVLVPLFATDGAVEAVAGITRDITDRKIAAAALAERNQELDSFVHTVSHDLKAPLRAISNLSVWIEDDLEDQLPPDNQQQFQLLRSRVKRMESMIDHLLLYARVGRQEAPLETFDVAELLREIIDSLAPPESFSIEIELPLPTLTTKRLFLSQVFTNLIGNAIKHHPAVNGHLYISALERRDCYEFSVRDDGPGIAPEHHAKIFTIFQTLRGVDNRDSTGVGLAIVKKIIETEGGTIWLESHLGKGTTFFFTWPKS